MWLPGRVIVGVILLIGCLAWQTRATQNGHVVISISNGAIVGERRGHYYAFEGLPYAKAPIGDRRFAPPELNDEQWDEPRNATALGAYCMQWSHTIPGKDKLFGEEDCLYLNVYTTALEPADTTLSTLVYIHGGAFMFGGGGFFSPTHVLQKPMIVVTFNYRLGPLGFLSTEDDIIPGNFGLKDQVTALQWVRKNIRHFGGDPGRVTLVGFSAGGASVHLHYLSPMSRGLFQNGIAHSGTALNPWVMAEDSAGKAKRIAQSLGCPTDLSQTLLSCLRERPAADIVRQVPFLLDYLYNPFSPLGVVVERQSKLNRKPFLVEHPVTLSRKGKLTKVPLILSVAQSEGLYPGAEFASKPGYLQDIDAHWYELLPSILDYKSAVPDATERDQLSRAISEHYFGKERKLTMDNFRDFISILSNRLFFVGATRAAKLLQPHLPVYFYYYNFKAAYGIGELLSGSLENYGVAHGDDTLLIFPSSMRDKHPYTDAERRVVTNFVTLYDTFSRGLEPMYGPDALPVQNITGKLQFLEVKAPPPCGTNCGGVRVAYGVGDEQFWESLDFHDDPTVKKPASKTVHTEL
uniref:Carboxylic ester hydrolase n=1 Tax=Anopheles atroparvus TaxID=41427 RepID=A0AAG5D6Z8_ANOAO